MSAVTTSAPSLAKSFALAPFTSLVSTRAEKSPFGSLRIARTKPPPCAPVAPITAITFLPFIVTFFFFHSAITRGYVSKCFDNSDSKSRHRFGVVSISLGLCRILGIYRLARSGVLEPLSCVFARNLPHLVPLVFIPLLSHRHHRKLSDVDSGPNRLYSFESQKHLMA